MKTRQSVPLAVGGTLFLSILASLRPCSAQAPAYTVTDLGTLGGARSYGYGLNNSGQVVGNSDFNGTSRGFLYSGGAMDALGTGDDSGLSLFMQATDIDNDGQISGDIAMPVYPFFHQPFLYSGGSLSRLPLPVGTALGSAIAVNSHGQVLVSAGSPDVTGRIPRQSFLYEGGVYTELTSPIPGAETDVHGMNDSGDIVGDLTGPDPVEGDWYSHGYVAHNGVI